VGERRSKKLQTSRENEYEGQEEENKEIVGAEA